MDNEMKDEMKPKMKLPKLSDEQKKVIRAIKKYNVITDSVAGSGKSVTSLSIAQKYPNENILLLTYNSKLKIETREKVFKLDLNNIEVHSYHSFCVKYYDRKCFKDDKILKIIEKDKKPLSSFGKYDIIVLDEAQDMTPLYFKLVCKLVKDSENIPKFCIIGDRYQSIFAFNGADERFIIFGEKIFQNGKKWKHVTLSTSYRITNQMSTFINKCVLKNNRLNATKDNIPVKYIICDTFGGKLGLVHKNRPYKEVFNLLTVYDKSDIFILAPSVRSDKSPVRQLANELSKNKIPIYVPNNDEEKLDMDVLNGKIVFSTFHQVKGLERKAVIIFNFDSSYDTFYNKGNNPNECSNPMYVALTRAKERLIVLHHYQNDYLQCVNKRLISKYSEFIVDVRLRVKKNRNNKTTEVAVTELTKFLPSNVITNAMEYFNVSQIKEKGEFIDVPVKTEQGKLYESVSEITGTAIPAYFEYLTTGKISILESQRQQEIRDDEEKREEIEICLFSANRKQSKNKLNGKNDSKNDSKNNKLDDKFNEILLKFNVDKNMINNNFGDQWDNSWNGGGSRSGNRNRDGATIGKNKNIKPDELLLISNKYCAKKSGYKYKLSQIKDYNWLSCENLEKCVSRLKNNISNNAKFEKKVSKNKMGRKIIGFIDCIDTAGSISSIGNGVNKCNIWEFKCVTKIQNEHFIQLAIYAYLGDFKNTSYYIFNILTDEIYQIEFDVKKLDKMIEYLIVQKYYNNKKISDDEFVKIMYESKNNYF